MKLKLRSTKDQELKIQVFESNEIKNPLMRLRKRRKSQTNVKKVIIMISCTFKNDRK